MIDTLRVHLDGTHVGEVSQSRQGALSFEYNDEYRASPNPTPLSLSLPLTAATHPNRAVRNYLEGLLPDNQATRARWGATYSVSPNNPFALLRHMGRDAAGAVQVLPESDSSTDSERQSGDIEWLTETDFITLVHDLAQHRRDWDPGRYAGRWSLAGAQSKVALHRDEAGRWGVPRDATPTTHIVKPAVAGFDDHHINEVLCQRTAAELGLPAAKTELIDLDEVRAVVSSRYDRRRDATGRVHRLHQEDLCQALSIHPSLKYQADGGPGVGEIADLLARLPLEDRQTSSQRFFDGLVFNVLIGGTDAHAKNYSLLLRGNRAQVAPLYDLASTVGYLTELPLESSMKIGDHRVMRSISRNDWLKAGRRLGLDTATVRERLSHLTHGLPAALDRATASLPLGTRDRANGHADRIREHAAVVAPSTW